ncbi:MAG: hypothetical protein WA958_13255 [Tunicatimonas sp.]
MSGGNNLPTNRVRATATTRTGLFEVGLPSGASQVYLDLTAQQGHIKGGHVASHDKSSASGYQLEGFFCGSSNRSKVYFHAALDREADSTALVYANRTTEFEEGLEDQPSGIVYHFKQPKPATLSINVGVSFVSAANARDNLTSALYLLPLSGH